MTLQRSHMIRWRDEKLVCVKLSRERLSGRRQNRRKRFAGTRGKGKAIVREPKIGENRGTRRFNALARRASKTMNG
jgi:hypothetical protein